jgi:hypothetical protein
VAHIDPHPVALCEGTPKWLLLQCVLNAITVQARLSNPPAARRPAEQLPVVQLGRQRRPHVLLLLHMRSRKLGYGLATLTLRRHLLQARVPLPLHLRLPLAQLL